MKQSNCSAFDDIIIIAANALESQLHKVEIPERLVKIIHPQSSEMFVNFWGSKIELLT